jgi:methyl-accepting chemotaxis protein
MVKESYPIHTFTNWYGIGTGIGGIASSVSYYNQLSADITNDIEQVARSILTMQNQLDSLASMVLQNWRELDLLTAKKGELYLFLNEECCFYVNQLGTVKHMAQQLQDQVTCKR